MRDEQIDGRWKRLLADVALVRADVLELGRPHPGVAHARAERMLDRAAWECSPGREAGHCPDRGRLVRLLASLEVLTGSETTHEDFAAGERLLDEIAGARARLAEAGLREIADSELPRGFADSGLSALLARATGLDDLTGPPLQQARVVAHAAVCTAATWCLDKAEAPA